MANFFSPIVLLLYIIVFVSFAGKALYSEANLIDAIPGGLIHANYHMDTKIGVDLLNDGLQSIKMMMLNTDGGVFPDANVSVSCIQRIISGIPVEALDASGKPPSGILGQNFNWLGHYDECVAIDGYQHSMADMLLVLPDGTTNSTKKLPVFWGLCMPATCDEHDIENLVLSATDLLNITWFQFNPKPPVDTPPGPIHINSRLPYDAGFICVVTMCSILGILMLLGAALDVYIQWSETPRNVNGYQQLNGKDQERERVHLLSGGTPDDSVHAEIKREEQTTPKTQGFLRKFLLCFAVNRSLEKLLNAKQGQNSIGCLNGIRVLSISWVILGHSSLYPLTELLYYNTAQAEDVVKRLDFTVIGQAEYAVDSFFFLSGCLLAYLTLGKMAKTDGKYPWGLFYFHRFWRLTPVYGAVIIFFVFVAPYIGNGPLWYRYTDHPNCRKYWWRNLLYISNFFTNKEMCMTWSWYLPNDMQFFVISPVLLILLHKVPKVGALLLSIVTFISVIAKTILSVYFGAGGILGANSDLDSHEYFNAIYDKPYTRISPYLVGMALGFIMARRPHIRMRPIVVLFGWLLATIVALVVIYVVNDSFYRKWSTAEVVIYSGFSSLAWALCLSWVVLACKNGYGGWINTFLSWDVWLPIGRLTYTVYLVHPIVIRTIYYSTSAPFRGVYLTLSTLFASNVVLAHGVALIFALAIEFPFANLEKLLLPSNAERKKSNI